MHGQAQHLGEDAHGGLAGVDLPVGVGGEANGGVQGHEGVHAGQSQGIERQPALEALQGVDGKESQGI